MDGLAAPTAGPSTATTHHPPYQQQPQHGSPIASKRTSSRNALADPFNDIGTTTASAPSPPSTPPNNRKRQSKRRDKGKQPLRAYASAEDGINNRHSHGLSWSSTTRDSVVDNLLFSLDNLSRSDIPDTPDAEFDRSKYRFPHAPPSFAMSAVPPRRARGHTYSSSVSTEMERSAIPESPVSVASTKKGRRSNSSSNFGVYNTVGGKNRSSRVSATAGRTSSDAQNPIANGIRTSESTVREESREAPRASYGYSTVLSSNRNRRSMSMDEIFSQHSLTGVGGDSILSRGRPVPSNYSSYQTAFDIAPEPSIAGGPRRKANPTATGPVYVNQALPRNTLRKTTTQQDLRSASNTASPTFIPLEVRNLASEFVRESALSSARPSTQSPNVTALPSPALPPSQAAKAPTIKERPGFFKRVFGGGSSRAVPTAVPDRTNAVEQSEPNVTPARVSSSNASQSRPATRQPSRDQPQGASYPPPSLNKKPSSFFRRRKKSMSEAPPPVPPLNMENLKVKEALKVAAAEPSPSGISLRAAMDPFLSADGKPANGVAKDDTSRPITQESSAEDSDNLALFHSGYSQSADAQLPTRSSSLKPKQSGEQEDSPGTKMKVKKRQPPVLSPTRTSFLEASGPGQPYDQAPVSPLTDHPPDNKENDRPPSRASTGDRIIASRSGVSPVDQVSELRKPSIVSTVSSGRPSHDRPISKKSDGYGPDPPLSKEGLSSVPEHHSRKTSNHDSVRSGPFHTATSAVFPPSVHSPLTPSSLYHSASSLPLPSVQVESNDAKISSEFVDEGAEYRERARKIFLGDEEDVTKSEAASWLGEKNSLSTRTLQAYIQLFDFAGFNILVALRLLCGKLVLKGAETQQFDRIITALSARWCECNPNHGFKAQDVVHTICYSLILLNTDLHLADIEGKMNRSAYVKNTLPTIKRVVADAAPDAFDHTVKPPPNMVRPSLPWRDSDSSRAQSPSFPPGSERTSIEQDRAANALRPAVERKESDNNIDNGHPLASNGLVTQPWSGTMRGWEVEVENILKSFFNSIRSDPLPLLGGPVHEPQPSDRNLSVANLNGMKRTNSVISKTTSDNASFRSKPGFRSMTLGFQNKYNRSRPKVYPASTLSSRTSMDDGNSVWSPGQSSTWSKYSFSKTLTSASMQSLGQHFTPTSDFKHSIGFANALSQAIIREENAAADTESMSMSVPGGLLDDEALTLEGAPWAKEGLVKHKHHMETSDKRAKERSWSDCFAVLSKGKLTLFAFNTATSKSQSMGRKALKQHAASRSGSVAAPKVGGGDWMENAEQLDVFILRHTIASTLPPPGYSKTRPHVWALSLPSGAVHLFQVGTPAIAQEFMTTANYWSARLSKEPLSGGVSNIEYGWSEQVINPALIERSGSPPAQAPPVSIQNRQHGHAHSSSGSGMPRPSVTSSIRNSFDTGFGTRTARLPGDKVHLADWQPPQQSMMASQLMEVDQLKGLTAYVSNVEEELATHNELKSAIELAYSPRQANYHRAMTNWQRKSDYLLREIVKFQTYIDSLTVAQKARDAFYARKSQHEMMKPVVVAEAEGEKAENHAQVEPEKAEGVETTTTEVKEVSVEQ